MIPDKDFVNKRFKVQNDVRSELATVWEDSYEKFIGNLQRVDERGAELNEVNINQSREKSLTITRFLCKAFLMGKRLFHLQPQAPDDVESYEIMEKYAHYIIRNIPSKNELMYKWFLQAVVKGFSPAKILPNIVNKKLKNIKFFPINNNDIWLDPQWTTGLIRDLFFEVRLTKEELESMEEQGLYRNTKKFIEKVKIPEGKEPREASIKTEGKKIPVEQHEGEYRVGEYWYSKEKEGNITWYLQVWGITGETNFEFILRGGDTEDTEIKSPYWFGHPFIFGLNNPAMYLYAGEGEPQSLKEIQKATNKVLNQKLDYMDIATNPPLLLAEGAWDEESDLNALVNPTLGGVAKLRRIGPGNIDWFRLPTVAPEAGQFMSFLLEAAEKASVRTNLLSGMGPIRGEPATTSLMNKSQAMESINFKIWVMSWAIGDLAEKLLLCIQQYKPKKDIVRVMGQKGVDFLKIDKRRRGVDGKMIAGDTFRLNAKREEALKFYDIYPVSVLEEPPEVMARRGIEAIQMLGQGVPPYITQKVGWGELIRQVLKGWGFIDVDKIYPESAKLPPELVEILANIPPELIIATLQQAGTLPPTPPGGMGGGSPAGAGGIAGGTPVDERANVMRQERAT